MKVAYVLAALLVASSDALRIVPNNTNNVQLSSKSRSAAVIESNN